MDSVHIEVRSEHTDYHAESFEAIPANPDLFEEEIFLNNISLIVSGETEVRGRIKYVGYEQWSEWSPWTKKSNKVLYSKHF